MDDVSTRLSDRIWSERRGDSYTGCAARTDRGATRGRPRSRVCVGCWISPLGWKRVCVGARRMGEAAPPTRTLGRASLGTSAWRLCFRGRPLALGRRLQEIGANTERCQSRDTRWRILDIRNCPVLWSKTARKRSLRIVHASGARLPGSAHTINGSITHPINGR